MDLLAAATGGVLIGLAAVWLYLALGRIAGISGITAQVLTNPAGATWPPLFIVGLGIGGWLALGAAPMAPPAAMETATALQFVAGGLLVGFGTRLGSGCTSGHGVCGMSRLAPRSLAATGVFLAVGMLVATSMQWL